MDSISVLLFVYLCCDVAESILVDFNTYFIHINQCLEISLAEI